MTVQNKRLTLATALALTLLFALMAILVNGADGGTTHQAAETEATAAAARNEIPEPLARFAEAHNQRAVYRASVKSPVGQLTAAGLEARTAIPSAASAATERPAVCLSLALAAGGGGLSCDLANASGGLDKPLVSITALNQGKVGVTGMLPDGATSAAIRPSGRPSGAKASKSVELSAGMFGVSLDPAEVGALTWHDSTGTMHALDLTELTGALAR